MAHQRNELDIRKNVLALILAVLMAGCTFNVNAIHHDELKAIDTANHFFLNLIKGNYKDAYDNQTNDRFKQVTPPKKFNSDMEELMHSYGAPTKASYDYFQPVPGQKAIQLFYNVNHRQEGTVQYIFYLEGDAEAGYKISGFRAGKKGKNPPPYVISNARMGDDIFAEATTYGIDTKGR